MLKFRIVISNILIWLAFSFTYAKIIDTSKIVERVVDISNIKIDKIVLAAPASLRISQGDNNLNIKADSNIINDIYFNMEKGKYIMKLLKKNKLYPYHIFEIELKVPNIKEIVLLGSGDIELKGFEKQSDLLINIEGSGDLEISNLQSNGSIDINLLGAGTVSLDKLANIDELKLNIEGSGNIEANGFVVKNLHLNILGAGDYEGETLEVDKCKAKIHGAGNARLGIIFRELEVDLFGYGNVYYKGNPYLSKKILGIGKVKKKD